MMPQRTHKGRPCSRPGRIGKHGFRWQCNRAGSDDPLGIHNQQLPYFAGDADEHDQRPRWRVPAFGGWEIAVALWLSRLQPSALFRQAGRTGEIPRRGWKDILCVSNVRQERAAPRGGSTVRRI